MKIISGAFTKLNKFLKANFSMLLLYEIRRKQFIIFCCMYYFSPSVAQNAHYRVIKGNAVNWHSHSLCTIFLFRSRILAISSRKRTYSCHETLYIQNKWNHHICWNYEEITSINIQTVATNMKRKKFIRYILANSSTYYNPILDRCIIHI